MSPARLVLRAMRPAMASSRSLTTTSRRLAAAGKSKEHQPTIEAHRKIQTGKPLNPQTTNTNSSIVNNIPSIGSEVGEVGELEVGQMEGAKFRVEPLRRIGEDANTMRARLVYQSRKRGTLESDLLMSTFADAHLPSMTMAQMAQYDLFLDENDWDIYYWATQEQTTTSQETAKDATNVVQGTSPVDVGKSEPSRPGTGEWAQTVGTFKPAYRPVPARWRNSEILAKLRRHVIDRSAGGIHEGNAEAAEDAMGHSARKTGGGMAFMPEVRNMDA